jgi:hypothetical protein
MSGVFGPIVLQVGLSLAMPVGDSDINHVSESPGVFGRVGSGPVYVWGSYNKQKLSLLGQDMGDNTTAAAGIGFEAPILPKLSLFAEAGYGWYSLDADRTVQQETVFTYLVDRHNVHESRPIPVTVNGPYDQDSYETTFELSDGLIGRVGVTYHVTSYIKLDVAYRHQRMDTLYEIYDKESRAAGGGWWQERTVIDASAIEMRLNWRF